MLWNASAIKGYAIEATDGHVGHVNDFLFSDVDWSIQSVVVGAGGWLHAHTVRLPSAVVGVPDPLRTQVVKAFIVLRDNIAPSEVLVEALQTHVRSRLSAHEYPRQMEFVSSLPMTATGKIIRRELRTGSAS